MFEDELSTTEETSPTEGQEVESADVQDQEVEQQEEQEVSNEETPEESQEDEGQGELIAGKFKSQDDLIKAYKNLEKQFHKSRQPEPEQQQYQQQQTLQQQVEDPNSVFWDAFQNNPMGTIQWLINQGVQEQVAPIYERQSTNEFAQNLYDVSQESPEYSQINTDEGLNKLIETVQDIAEELGNPELASNPSKRMLRMAAQEAFGNKADLYKQAKQKGYEEAEQNRKAKQGLGAPSTKKPKQADKSPEEQLADMIVSAGRSGGIFG